MRKRSSKQTGATLIDYALIVALISVTSIVALRELGLQAQRPFCQAVEFGVTEYNGKTQQWDTTDRRCLEVHRDDDDGMMPG